MPEHFFGQHPARYLEHLYQTPQLIAPEETLLLSQWALSIEGRRRPDVATFAEWLDTEIGQAVIRRIQTYPSQTWLYQKIAPFDTLEDVRQNALIYLWQRWSHDHHFIRLTRFTTSFEHDVFTIARIAMMSAQSQKTHYQQSHMQLEYLFAASFVHQADLRIDIDLAIEQVVRHMVKHHSIAAGNYRRVPIEHITRTIITGYRFYYVDRYSHKGSVYHFCQQQGVSKSVIQKWRPIIFAYLRRVLQ